MLIVGLIALINPWQLRLISRARVAPSLAAFILEFSADFLANFFEIWVPLDPFDPSDWATFLSGPLPCRLAGFC